jgi:hypothetical protein
MLSSGQRVMLPPPVQAAANMNSSKVGILSERMAESGRRDILGLKTLGPLLYFHGDFLAVDQSPAAFGIDCGMVDEHVGTVLLLDKTEPFLVVEPLDGSGNYWT